MLFRSKEFCDAAAKNDANNLALMDEKFHSEIIKRCGNNLMIDVMERLNMGLKDFRNNTFSIKQNVKDTIGPHEKILKAIITKDSAKAEREMKKHIVLMETNLTLNIVTLEDGDSGLSSSAAFEMGMASIWNEEYSTGLTPAELADRKSTRLNSSHT